MKRWFTVLLAVMLMLTAVHAGAEEPLTNAEIQESLASLENGETGSLADMLSLLGDLLMSEDVRSLLAFEDVQEIVDEVLAKVLVWLYRNRPVTFEILAELGVGGTERTLIGRIWDSMDRVIASSNEYLQSEDGIRLISSWDELREDEDFIRFREDFFNLASREDVENLINALASVLQENGRELVQLGTELKESSEGKEDSISGLEIGKLLLEKGLESQNFLTNVLRLILTRVAESKWATASLPALLEKECFWNALKQTSQIRDSVVQQTIAEEIKQLWEDDAMKTYLTNTICTVIEFIRSKTNAESSPDNPS